VNIGRFYYERLCTPGVQGFFKKNRAIEKNNNNNSNNSISMANNRSDFQRAILVDNPLTKKENGGKKLPSRWAASHINPIKNKLADNGVLYIPKIIKDTDCLLLEACAEIAILDRPGTQISGDQMMYDIPVANITDTSKYRFGKGPLNQIETIVQKLIGEEYHIASCVSFLVSPRSHDQMIHADNVLSDRFNGLLVLSDGAPPTSLNY
jgi:hypothetical protein